MKITKQHLKQIIKEELETTINEEAGLEILKITQAVKEYLKQLQQLGADEEHIGNIVQSLNMIDKKAGVPF